MTAFLFKELRCTCRGPQNNPAAKAKNYSRTQTSVRINQRRQLAKSRQAQLMNGSQIEVPIGPGTIIGGAFQIERIIGQGGMGIVYLASHKNMQQRYALKVLAPNLVSEQYWMRFQAEAKTLASLKHPCMVSVYDLGIHQKSVFYYSMDYLEGRNLEDILAREGPQSIERTLEIFLAVLDGLTYAHRNGIIHRDIKPANIFICSKSASGAVDVKILDFGIAKLIKADGQQELTSVGEIFGSPYYMSPEQCNGQDVDVRSDIYSVGCSIFETLSGLVPFEADSAVEIALMHEEDKPPSVAEIVGNSLLKPFDFVIAKCMAKIPNQRYQSAKELALDLERIRDGKSVAAELPAPKQLLETDLADENQSKTAIKLIFAFICLAGISVGIFYVWQTFFVHDYSKILAAHEKARANERAEALALERQAATSAAIDSGADSDSTKAKAFLKTNKANYSRMVEMNGRMQKAFYFPSDFSLGTIQFPDYRYQNAQGRILLAQNCNSLPLLQANQIVQEFPELLSFFGKDELQGIGLPTGNCSPELLNQIGKLTSLKTLDLFDSEEVDFARLDRLTKLEDFTISLANPKSIAEFVGCKILPQLRKLEIRYCSNASTVLEKLTHSEKMKSLSLRSTPISDFDCKQIATIENLEELSLRSVQMTDHKLELLAAKNLRNLNITTCTGLTAGCRPALLTMKNLNSLALPDGIFSYGQIVELKKRIRDVTVPLSFESIKDRQRQSDL